MNKKMAIAQLRKVALVAAAMIAGVAQAAGPLDAPYAGGSIGSTDGFGTALRVFGGSSITNIVGWEASLTSYGKGSYGFGQWRKATEFGGSLWAKMPLSTSWSATGKFGLHYVDYTDSNSNRSDSSLEPGIGLGLQWHFAPNASARFEVEHIAGEAGDLVLAGVQVRF